MWIYITLMSLLQAVLLISTQSKGFTKETNYIVIKLIYVVKFFEQLIMLYYHCIAVMKRWQTDNHMQKLSCFDCMVTLKNG
jgi:hypothetical protein